ncbi:unnamed protein product [Linum tenue]|uniref:HMG box domain-containing protein n=1 Tax=Linum tenue TaxID=586396 RepID=A0AAV0MDR9_9ROSI|nr:unnamed protein product [Linum tenue]
MAGNGSVKANPTKARKRVEADNGASGTSMVRARNGSAFTRCEECKKDVAVALIGMHSCSLDAKIKMNLEAQVVENPAEVKPTGDFRKTYKEANPDSKDVKKVAKEAGEKWKSMTDEEKKPYLEKAAQLKADHGKTSGNSSDTEPENGAAADKEGEDVSILS